MTRVLDLTQYLLYVIGCQYVNSETLPCWYNFYRVVALVGMFSLSIPLITFMLWVDSDVATSAQTLTMIIGEGIVVAKALLVHRNRVQLKCVLDTLQTDADASGNGKHFAWAQRISHTLAIVNNVSFLVTSSAYFLVPAGVIAVHLLNGSFTMAVLSWPYKCLYVMDKFVVCGLPFDEHTLSGFLTGYAVEFVFDFYVITTFMAMDGLFVGLCVYALAYLRDLGASVRQLDTHFLRTRDTTQLHANLVQAVRQHRHIKVWINRVGDLFSEIILVQFGAGSLLIADFVYQIQMSDGGNVIAFLLMSGSLLGQMFIYCYASTRVTYMLMSTSDQVYACHWYEYPVRLQPFVANMVQQMQRPHYMSGMGIVNCSLKSFTSLLNFVGTMIAVLQSMK